MGGFTHSNYNRRVLAFVAALLAAGTTAKAAAPPPVASLSWLPAATHSISGAPGANVPLLHWMRDTATAAAKHFPGALDDKLPDCWARVTAPVVASYQVWAAFPLEESAVLVQGHVDRRLLESCLDTTMRNLRSPPRISRTGAITQFEAESLGNWSIGWTPAWLVVHSSRGRVEELLAALKRKASIAPALAAAIARANRSAFWGATTLDYSSVFLDVPSRSVVMTLPSAAEGIVYCTWEYASAEDATRAVRAMDAASRDPELGTELRRIVHDARYLAKDRFMVLELDARLFTDGATMAAMQAWIERKRAAPARP